MTGTARSRTDEDGVQMREELWQLQLQRIRATAAPSLSGQGGPAFDLPVRTPAAAPADRSTAREGARRRPSAARRLGSAALTLLLLAVIALTLFVAYGTVADNRWYKIVAIEGGSMAPSLEQGDAILITRPPARLEAGTVVVLQVESGLVTHRVVAVNSDGTFVTKGDANDNADDWTNVDVHVVGVVRGHVPLLGRVLRLAGTASWLNDRSDVPVDGTAG